MGRSHPEEGEEPAEKSKQSDQYCPPTIISRGVRDVQTLSARSAINVTIYQPLGRYPGHGKVLL